MSCAACSARVEKAVSGVPGVEKCSVNLLTNSMTVEGTAEASVIISAVEKTGYGAALEGVKKSEKNENNENRIKYRLVSSVIILAVLMYFSMGASMFGLPLPEFFENPAVNAVMQMFMAGIVMVINQKFFISGFKGLINRAPNMDTLVALGSGASFLYSLYALAAMINEMGSGGDYHIYAHDLYFESAAMILTLITVGKLLEERSKGKTTDAILGLMKLAPKNALVERDGCEIEIPATDLVVGDIFIVRAGASIPADGVITEGNGSIDESSITGESIPVEKAEGDSVCAASVNTVGFFKCRATKVGQDTLLSQIIKMVSDASASKAPIAKVADRVSGIFVPVVITVAVVTAIVWLMLGESVGFAVARGVSVLVISCPCALGLATPVAVMVGSGVGAKNGILFKTAAALEETGRAKIAVLDKTGTITSGTPEVTDVFFADGVSRDELLELAYSVEKKSEHPLGRAVVRFAEENNVKCHELSEFRVLPGNGVSGRLNKEVYYGGSQAFSEKITDIPEDIRLASQKFADEGKTPLFFCSENGVLGIIAVADKIRDDSADAVSRLQAFGVKVVMLTGDNQRTAEAIGRTAGIECVIAGVLPDGKERAVRELQRDGKVIMVGDGINDAPALTAADIGIAVGAGTDIAIDSADVVLMKSNLSDVAAAITLSRGALRNIHQNLFWAFFYNAIGIPLAAGVFINLFGWKLNPMFGAAAMSLSSFFVVTNALRLNFIKIRSGKNIKPERKKKMTKTMKIEGMMCGHCSGRVKKVLEELSGVASAEVSHEAGTAIVTLSADIADEVLKKCVEDQGYTVVG